MMIGSTRGLAGQLSGPPLKVACRTVRSQARRHCGGLAGQLSGPPLKGDLGVGDLAITDRLAGQLSGPPLKDGFAAAIVPVRTGLAGQLSGPPLKGVN